MRSKAALNAGAPSWHDQLAPRHLESHTMGTLCASQGHLTVLEGPRPSVHMISWLSLFDEYSGWFAGSGDLSAQTARPGWW
jgi:hypothetical protein